MNPHWNFRAVLLAAGLLTGAVAVSAWFLLAYFAWIVIDAVATTDA